MNQADVQSKRERLRTAEDELTRTTTLLSRVGEFSERSTRGANTDPDSVKEAYYRFIDPAPMDQSERAEALSHINEPLRDGKDFVQIATERVNRASPTSVPNKPDTSLSTFVEIVSKYQNQENVNPRWIFNGLIDDGSPELTENLVMVLTLLAESARAARDRARNELNNDYPDDAADGQGTGDPGAIQQFVDSKVDPIEDLDEHPIALLPVKLETRFVRPPDDPAEGKEGVSNPELYHDLSEPQLWVRVYPDSIHVDDHEPQLTDEEIKLAKDFWAYCWYATFETLPIHDDEERERDYLDALLDDRRAEILAGLDPKGFPDDPIERKKRIKERIWNQLLDRFGRERAAYVVNEMAPDVNNPGVPSSADTNPQVLLSLGRPSDDSEGERVGGHLVSEVVGIRPSPPDLVFPEPERKPETWTRPPKARLLPDQWLVYGEWKPDSEGDSSAVDVDIGNQIEATSDYDVYEGVPSVNWDTGTVRDDLIGGFQRSDGDDGWSGSSSIRSDGGSADEGGSKTTFVKWTAAVREDLPVGPTPEQLTMAKPDAGGSGSTGGGDEALEWLTDFGEAEKAGMAFRITASDVFGDSSVGLEVTDGTFETLIVTGVKTSMDHQESAESLRKLFEAHHYTDGLELLEVGTPTNNFDTTSGYTSADEPVESMMIETRAESLVTHGDNTDGDRLARALAINPRSTDEDHVFARVENADKTEWLDSWHMRSALWPATGSYYMQNMLVPNWFADLPSQKQDEHGHERTPSLKRIANALGWHESWGRHFIEHVTPTGLLSSFRIDRQPYGVLPVTPFADERDDVYGLESEEQPSRRTGDQDAVPSGSDQFIERIQRSVMESQVEAPWLQERDDNE